MEFATYQSSSNRTLPKPAHATLTDTETQLQLATFGLGIAGEAGEVADLIKKHVGHGHTLDQQKLVKELGDVLWYISALCTLNGLSLADVARTNVAKLRLRYPDGFTEEASINRKEGA